MLVCAELCTIRCRKYLHNLVLLPGIVTISCIMLHFDLSETCFIDFFWQARDC